LRTLLATAVGWPLIRPELGHAAVRGPSDPHPTPPARRRALIFGNAHYPDGVLRNPVHDARLIASSANSLGFQVDLREDQGRTQMLQGLSTFLDDASTADVRLFYFAGHGSQFRGRNFLLPVDARVLIAEDVPASGIDAQDLLDRLSRCTSGVNLLVFDACRQAAGESSPRLPMRGLRGTGATVRELAPMIAPQGTLLVYSTAPDRPAFDGSVAGPGPFARHLAEEMRRVGVPIEVVLKRVRWAVMQETGNRQVPWDASSLTGDFYLAGSGN
jgi:uncharacterized caspase-like protein